MSNNHNRGQSTSFTPEQIEAVCLLLQRDMTQPDGGLVARNSDLQCVYRKFITMRDKSRMRAIDEA